MSDLLCTPFFEMPYLKEIERWLGSKGLCLGMTVTKPVVTEPPPGATYTKIFTIPLHRIAETELGAMMAVSLHMGFSEKPLLIELEGLSEITRQMVRVRVDGRAVMAAGTPVIVEGPDGPLPGTLRYSPNNGGMLTVMVPPKPES